MVVICESPYSGDDGPYDPTLRALCDDLLGQMTYSAVDMWTADLGSCSQWRWPHWGNVGKATSEFV